MVTVIKQIHQAKAERSSPSHASEVVVLDDSPEPQHFAQKCESVIDITSSVERESVCNLALEELVDLVEDRRSELCVSRPQIKRKIESTDLMNEVFQESKAKRPHSGC